MDGVAAEGSEVDETNRIAQEVPACGDVHMYRVVHSPETRTCECCFDAYFIFLHTENDITVEVP